MSPDYEAADNWTTGKATSSPIRVADHSARSRKPMARPLAALVRPETRGGRLHRQTGASPPTPHAAGARPVINRSMKTPPLRSRSTSLIAGGQRRCHQWLTHVDVVFSFPRSRKTNWIRSLHHAINHILYLFKHNINTEVIRFYLE